MSSAQNTLDQLDHDILRRVQASPRVSWRRVGDAIGVSPDTVSRRWRRLERDGEAWTSALPGHHAAYAAILDISCDVESGEGIGEKLAARPEVVSVFSGTGSAELAAIVMATSWQELTGGLAALRSLCGGARVDVRPCTGPIGGFSGTRGVLDAARASSSVGAAAGRRAMADERDRALLSLLSVDARLGYDHMAEVMRSSPAGVRRRLLQLERRGDIALLCDHRRVEDGAEQDLWVDLSVRYSGLLHQVDALAKWPESYFVAATTGTSNLTVLMTARSGSHAEQLLERLEGGDDVLSIDRTRLVLAHRKRFGRLLDARGMSSGAVPFASPGAAVQIDRQVFMSDTKSNR